MAFRELILVTLLFAGFSFAAEPPYEFTPQAGFGGKSEGQGTLTIFFGKPQAFHVVSYGMAQSDGSFRLEQRVAFEGKPPQDRVWILTTISPDHYSATLTDAAGPATGVTSGSRLSLRYRVKGPLVMHQELQLMSDKETIDNVGVITLLGIPVGHLHETIKRKDHGLTSNGSFKPKPLRGSAWLLPTHTSVGRAAGPFGPGDGSAFSASIKRSAWTDERIHGRPSRGGRLA